MVWAVIVFVLATAAGLVVLGLLGWRLWQQLRSLTRTIKAAEQRLAPQLAALEAAQARRPDGRRTSDW